MRYWWRSLAASDAATLVRISSRCLSSGQILALPDPQREMDNRRLQGPNNEALHVCSNADIGRCNDNLNKANRLNLFKTILIVYEALKTTRNQAVRWLGAIVTCPPI